MMKFFKKVRKILLYNKKIRKYLIYSVGEIVLVVAGILIALSINNKSEQNKKEIKAISNLEEIQENLFEDIKSSNMISHSYFESYLIGNKILDFKKPLTLEDFNKETFSKIDAFINHFIIDRNGYNNLTNNIDHLPQKFRFLLKDFRMLYIDNSSIINIYNNRLLNTVNSHQNYLSTKDWNVHYLEYGNHSIQEIDYYINDYRYKNFVLNYLSDKKNIFLRSQQYREIAINTCKKIDSILERDTSDLQNQLLNLIHKKEIKEYLGIYQYQHRNDGEKFFIKNNKLYSNYYTGTEEDITSTINHTKINDSVYITLDDFNPDFWMFKKSKEGIISIQHLKSNVELIRMDSVNVN